MHHSTFLTNEEISYSWVVAEFRFRGLMLWSVLLGSQCLHLFCIFCWCVDPDNF